MRPPSPIDVAYKKANRLLDDFGTKYEIQEVDLDILKGEVNQVMVLLHNEVLAEIKENALQDIIKVYEKYGYRR